MRWQHIQVALAGASVAALFGCSNFMTSVPIRDGQVERSSDEPITTYALPRGLVQIKFTKDAAADKDKVTITAKNIPDTRFRFRVDYSGNWFSNDAVKISTANGLLTSLWSRVEDRTNQVIINLARSIGAAQGFVVPAGIQGKSEDELPPRLRKACAGKEWMPKETNFTLLVDPVRDRNAAGWPGWLSIDSLQLGAADAPATPTPAQIAMCEKGLCTRTVAPWRVRIDLACGVMQDEVIYLPNEADAVPIQLDRTMFAARRFYVDFAEGLVTEVRLSKPSSAEALAQLPEGVLKALVSVPSDLVKLRVNYDIERKNLTAAELARLQQEQAWRDYLASLAGQKAGAAPTPAVPAPTITPTTPPPGAADQPTVPVPQPDLEDWDPQKETGGN